MSELSTEVRAIARKNEQAILRALASVGGATVARHIGVSESTITRWKADPTGSKDNAVYGIALVLALHEQGQKIVPQDWLCESPEVSEAMRVLAGKYLENRD